MVVVSREPHSSCAMKDLVGNHICKLREIIRSYGVYPRDGYRFNSSSRKGCRSAGDRLSTKAKTNQIRGSRSSLKVRRQVLPTISAERGYLAPLPATSFLLSSTAVSHPPPTPASSAFGRHLS